MKKSNSANPAILHTLLPAPIDLVSLCEEFRTLFIIESNALDIWLVTELSATAWSPISSFIFLKVASLLARLSNFWSFFRSTKISKDVRGSFQTLNKTYSILNLGVSRIWHLSIEKSFYLCHQEPYNSYFTLHPFLLFLITRASLTLFRKPKNKQKCN